MSIGEEIKKNRNAKGFTQDELAEKIGISRNYISDLENNRYAPSVKTLSKIAVALQMDLNFLLKMSEIQDKNNGGE
jgi:transcriptional regulator with XRE-family HTH domain